MLIFESAELAENLTLSLSQLNTAVPDHEPILKNAVRPMVKDMWIGECVQRQVPL